MLGKDTEVVGGWSGISVASPIFCFLFPLLPFLFVCGNTRHVHGKAGVVNMAYLI